MVSDICMRLIVRSAVLHSACSNYNGTMCVYLVDHNADLHGHFSVRSAVLAVSLALHPTIVTELLISRLVPVPTLSVQSTATQLLLRVASCVDVM